MLRKILFQIHLWTGLGVGLYVVAICVTGSVLVFRNEFYNYFRPGTTVAARATERLTDEAIAEGAAKRRYPGFEVTYGAAAAAEPYRPRRRSWLEEG